MTRNNFDHFGKITKKRPKFPAVRINKKGYFILNSLLVNQVGERPGGVSIQLQYSTTKNCIGIKFIYGVQGDLEKCKHQFSGIGFIKECKIKKIDHNKFYEAHKILSSKNDEVWEIGI